jgi:hypothetical protein
MDALDHILSKFNKSRVMVVGSREVGSSTTPPGNGTTVLAPTFVTSGFSRITVVAKAPNALTVNVYQGSAPTVMEVVTAVAVPANAAEGAGAGATIEVVGSHARIDVVNAGAAGATFTFSACLRGLPDELCL